MAWALFLEQRLILGDFEQPTDVHFTPKGDLLVADSGNDRVVQVKRGRPKREPTSVSTARSPDSWTSPSPSPLPTVRWFWIAATIACKL